MGASFCLGLDAFGSILHPRRARTCDRCDGCPACPSDKGRVGPLRTVQGSRLCPTCREEARRFAALDPAPSRPILPQAPKSCPAEEHDDTNAECLCPYGAVPARFLAEAEAFGSILATIAGGA